MGLVPYWSDVKAALRILQRTLQQPTRTALESFIKARRVANYDGAMLTNVLDYAATTGKLVLAEARTPKGLRVIKRTSEKMKKDLKVNEPAATELGYRPQAASQRSKKMSKSRSSTHKRQRVDETDERAEIEGRGQEKHSTTPQRIVAHSAATMRRGEEEPAPLLLSKKKTRVTVQTMSGRSFVVVFGVGGMRCCGSTQS
jgi:hypothetical protein